MKTAPHAVALWVGTCCLAGCSGWQSALDPQGPQAKHLADLIWTFTIVCSLIWVVVILALLVGLSRRHQERPDPVVLDRDSERRMTVVVGGAVVLTALTVIALTMVSYFSQHKLFARNEPAVTINLTGHQWWWGYSL